MTLESYKPKSVDETSVLELYHRLIQSWNDRDAHAFAHLFSGTAMIIGFDGSAMHGFSEAETELTKIFTGHETGIYLTKIRDIKCINDDCFLLLAIAGMVPPGSSWVDPSKNAMQTLLAARKEGKWYIELFQNTPAQFHGRPQLAEELTEELNEVM